MSTFQRELRVPGKAVAVVIGKGGSTMKAFQKTPGISSVRLSYGKVQIRGHSQKAVEQVASSIEGLVNFAIDKSRGFFADFFAFCFCKSVDDPFVAVNTICFEKFDSAHISNVSHRSNGVMKSNYCFKSGQPCDQGSSSSSSSERSTEYSVDDDDLSAQFCRKTSITGIFFFPQWDLQTYKDTLLSRLEPLLFQQYETMRTIKLIIRFGKELFFGVDWSDLRNGGLMPLTQVQELCRLERLNQRFSTACAEGSVASLRLHLDDLKVRSEPRRHGFVNFCREGKGTTDFRLGLVTHGTDMDIHPDMVEWIDEACRNRTSHQLLVFDPPTRFQAMHIRYKESETYMTDDWKLRIARVRDGDRAVSKSPVWECALSSRWFKKNGGLTDDMEAIMGNVAALVKEAGKVSEHMGSSSQG
eukprot:Gb_07236 [translate_table: standard]